MKKNKKWWIIPVCIVVLILTSLVLVMTNYQVRVSLLMNLTRGQSCWSVSSDGKWLGCGTSMNHESPSQAYIILYSTDFPFRKINVLLPDLRINENDGYYRDITASSWSPSGSIFVVTIRKIMDINTPELCVILIHDIDSYDVNCFSTKDKQNGGRFSWSVNGDSLIYSDHPENDAVHITVLDTSVNIINQFDIPHSTLLNNNEELENYDLIGDGPNIFVSLGFRPKAEEGRPIPDVDRTQVYRLSVNDPKDISLLIDEQGDYGLLSIDPGGQYILLIQNRDSEFRSNKVQLVDAMKGGLVKDISTNPLGNDQKYLYKSYCLTNCSRTAAEFYADSQNHLLVWSWDKMNYSIYPDDRTVIGNDSSLEGFLCLWNNFQDSGIVWLNICR